MLQVWFDIWEEWKWKKYSFAGPFTWSCILCFHFFKFSSSCCAIIFDLYVNFSRSLLQGLINQRQGLFPSKDMVTMESQINHLKYYHQTELAWFFSSQRGINLLLKNFFLAFITCKLSAICCWGLFSDYTICVAGLYLYF